MAFVLFFLFAFMLLRHAVTQTKQFVALRAIVVVDCVQWLLARVQSTVISCFWLIRFGRWLRLILVGDAGVSPVMLIAELP